MTNSRFPKNAPGDFYTTGEISSDGQWNGSCLQCGLPEIEAPDLLSPLTDDDLDTYFVKQPVSDAEIDQAIAAIEVCCVSAIRYGGNDPDILKRIYPDASDNMRPEFVRNHEALKYHSKFAKFWRLLNFGKRDK